MNELRWILLLIGLAIIVGTLIYSQISQHKQEQDLFGSQTNGDPLLGDSDDFSEDGFSADDFSADDNDIHPYESADLSDYDTSHDTNHSGRAALTEEAVNTDDVGDSDNADELQAAEVGQHIVVLHVIAQSEEGFSGQALKDQLEHLGLRHGNYNFYHRESLQNPDISLFSVANMFKPGEFDANDIDTYATKGISFFLVLPGPPDALTTFNEMLQTAKQLASKLEGDVYDADRSTFTGQRAQLIRDEIISFMHKVSQV